MKLTKSKQFLADAIHASGNGWPDGASWACQSKTTYYIYFATGSTKPIRSCYGYRVCSGGIFLNEHTIRHDKLNQNWHQTVLSREEYFSAYPAEPVVEPVTDADGWIEWSGGECPVAEGDRVDFVGLNYYGSDRLAGVLDWGNITQYRLHKPAPAEKLSPETVVDAKSASMSESIEDCVRKPTIEQLAADYRARNDFAGRLQQYADEAKADAEAKLAELVEAGKALGLDVMPITIKQEPEPVITDWRKLQIGDVIKCIGDAWVGAFEGKEATVVELECDDYKYEHRIHAEIGSVRDWGCDFEFIRRP